MAGAPCQITPFQVVDGRSGVSLPGNGFLLYTYAAGTNNPLATFTDSTLGTPNTNPVVMNSAGYAVNAGVITGVWVGAAAYKFVLKDAGGVTIWTQDNIIDAGQALKALLATSAGATLIKYLRRSNVSITVQAALAELFIANPVDYGADPTGVVDSSAAFAAALAVGDVYVPFGHYIFLTPLSMVTSYQSITCAPGTILQYTGTDPVNGAVIIGLGGVDITYNVKISGARIIANSHCVAALYVTQVVYSEFTNIIVHNVDSVGIGFYFIDGNTNVVHSPSCQGIFQAPHPALQGIVCLRCVNYTFINPKLEECVNEGFSSISAGGNVIIGGTSEGNGTGISLDVGSLNWIVQSLDTEVNSVAAVVDAGQDNVFFGGVQGTLCHVKPTAKNSNWMNVEGNQLTIDAGAIGTRIIGGHYNNDGTSGITDNGISTMMTGVRGDAAHALEDFYFPDKYPAPSGVSQFGVSPAGIFAKLSLGTDATPIVTTVDAINIGDKTSVMAGSGIFGPSVAIYADTAGLKCSTSLNVVSGLGADNALVVTLVDNEGVSFPLQRGISLRIYLGFTLQAGVNTLSFNGIVKNIVKASNAGNLTVPYSVIGSFIDVVYSDGFDEWVAVGW